MGHAPVAELVGVPAGVPGTGAAPEEPNAPAEPGRQRLPFDARLVLAGILALAAGLRFALLAQNSVWLDEAFMVWVAQHPLKIIPGLLRSVDQHPPVYFMLMHLWIGVAGAGEAAIRVPSACFSLCSVWLTYVLVRRVSTQNVGLLSAFLVAVSPFQIAAAQEARMYPLLGALALASTLALLSSVDRGGVGRWAGYLAASTLMAYTHYLGGLVLLAHGIWVGCCERRHLGRWAICIAGVAVLYVPWAPAFFEQIRNGHSYGWYHNHALYMNLNDLLGLWAFGGSLFGMASYFFTGTVGPVEQLIVLAPFLVLLWRGATALGAAPRSLALLGLPPLVTLGAAFLISWTRPMFIPRWFSFVLPFLTAVLARGVYDIAERVEVPRERLIPFLIAALLLYQVPALDRYYTDPEARPFQWRAAARLVRALGRPGDALVFVGSPAAIPFKYYFRDPVPSLELAPEDRVTPTEAQMRQLTAQHPRVWLIATIPFTAETRDRILGRLGTAYRAVGLRQFSGAIVYLLATQQIDR